MVKPAPGMNAMDEPTLESHGVKQSSQPIGPTAVKLALFFALVALVAGLYLWQASEIAVTGRRIEALRQQQQEVQRENTDLLDQIAVEGSMPRLQERAARLGYSPAAQVDYIAVTAVPPDTLSALHMQGSGK